MKIFKTYMFFSDHDQGQSYLIDTIRHEGAWWLVASWLQSNDTGDKYPGRLIRLSGLRYQEVDSEPYRFLLNNSLKRTITLLTSLKQRCFFWVFMKILDL